MKIVAIFIALTALILVGALVLKYKSALTTEASNEGFPPEVTDWVDKERAAREKVRASDPQFFAAVSKVMFEHDPISINFGDNSDEYDAEAGSVIPRLSSCSSPDDVATVVHEEFVRWFGEETAGERSHYVSLANYIWVLWEQKSSLTTQSR